jgi:hypothetical protein
MITRYSLNTQPVDMIGENCERLPVGEVTYLQDSHNVNMCDECDNWFDDEPYVVEFSEVDIETLFFPEEIL